MAGRRTPLFVVALGAFALGACECIKTVPQCPDGVKCITYDEYCDQANQASWSMLQHCGLVDPGADYPLGFDQRSALCTAAMAEKIDAGHVRFEPVAAYQCLEKQRESCDPKCRWYGAPRLPQLNPNPSECSPPCDHVFEGTRTSGETCELSTECLDGLYCDLEHGCPGRCATQHRVGEGVSRVEACRTGFAISLIDGGLRCDDLIDAGAPCERADDEQGFHRCAPGLACVEPPLTTDGGHDGGTDGGAPDAGEDGGLFDAGPPPLACRSWPDAGAVPDVDCSRAGCPFGQLCTGRRCELIPKRGQACVVGLAPCPEGLGCVVDGGGTFCEPNPSAGSACAPGIGQCDAKSICEGNFTAAVCIALASDGGACDDLSGCVWPLRCHHVQDAGVCGPGVAPGGACDDTGFDCQPGSSCLDGGCVAVSCPPSR